jgi:hypothetical protein
MKRFLKNIALFMLPLIIGIVGIEWWLGNYPATFQLKAAYVTKHAANIEILVLGSSHNQTAINPEYFTKNTANLSFGGQDINLDSKLLDRYISRLPKLKYVFFELGYHGLEIMHDGTYEKNALYLRMYGINNFGRRNNAVDYSIFLSNPGLYSIFLNPFAEKLVVNKYGFTTKLSPFEEGVHRFEDMKYDVEKINKDHNNLFIQRHRNENPGAYRKNKVLFENMIKKCVSHHITPVIVIPPVYTTYYNEMLPAKKQRRDNLIAYIRQHYPSVLVFDHEKADKFDVTDFSNEDHLNPKGAAKFTRLLDKELLDTPTE